MSPELKERIETLIGAMDLSVNVPASRHLPIIAHENAAILSADLRALLTAAQGQEWRPIAEAPRDGTPILGWCVHPNAKYAGDADEWAAPVVAQWTTHNSGGWTWHGLAGRIERWMPFPPAPQAKGEG